MASIGAGYDLSASTYSPEGRIFQVEYAAKAVESSGTIIGIKVKNGLVLAVEKALHSKLLKKQVNRKIFTIDLHAGFVPVGAGLAADCRQLANRARQEASSHRDVYEVGISGSNLAERLGLFLHAYTSYSSVRPFGVTSILAAFDKDGPHLYMIEPSGVYCGYRACAAGKGYSLAKTELEKLDFDSMTAKQAVFDAVRIIYQCHEDSKDQREFEVEVSWIAEESDFTHQMVPVDLQREAETKANDTIMAAMDYE